MISAAATTYEIRYMLPVVVLFPILILYSIGCAKRAAAAEEPSTKKPGPFPEKSRDKELEEISRNWRIAWR